MSAIKISPPFEFFTDINGEELEAGYIYIGAPDQDPEANPIQAYWDRDLTVQASQPLRTIAGLVDNSGSPSKVYVGGTDYSITVRNRNGTLVYTDLKNTGTSVAASDISYVPGGIGAVSRTVQDKLREVVSVEDYGAVGDGSTDDTAAIQAAVTASRVVDFQSKTYKIEGTVELPSNSWLRGKPGTCFLGIMTPEGTGGYPNQMFRNIDQTSGNENIYFSHIKFDFAKDGFDYDDGPGLTSINSLLFTRVENLAFADCDFFDFVTNYNTSLTGKGLLAFGMAQFDQCSRVSFNRISNENIREEGFNFYRCSQVSFDGWRAKGNVVNTSSHAGIWYCDVVSIKNARFTHTGGSAINNCSRNVLYENIAVNEGEAQDGRGFDFGNELDAEPFEQGNITIQNCTLNVQDYGIYIQGGTAYNDVPEAVNITGNRIYVSQGSAGTCYGVRVLSPKACTIEGNFIFLSDVAATGLGQCVTLTLLTDSNDTGFCSNIRVIGNFLRGLTGFNLIQNNDTAVDGLYVRENTFVSQDIGALSSYAGASVFFYVRNTSAAVVDLDLSDVYVEKNAAYNLGGGGFVMSLDDPTKVAINNFNVNFNHFAGGSTGMDRGFVFNGGTSGGGNGDVRFIGNTIEDGNAINFLNLKYVQMDRNLSRWATTFTTRRMLVLAHNGTCEITNNRFYNCSTVQNDIEDSGGTFDIVNVSGNATKTDLSTLVWNSTMPANTVLPN